MPIFRKDFIPNQNPKQEYVSKNDSNTQISKKFKKSHSNQKSNSTEASKKESDKIQETKEKKKGTSADTNDKKSDDKSQKGVHSWRNFNNMGMKSAKATTQLHKEQDPENSENIMNLIDDQPKQPQVDFNELASFDHNECVDNIQFVSQKDKKEAIRKND